MTVAERAADNFRHSKMLHGYANGKAAWDPAYAFVACKLGESPRPLLDIGCGVGLLAAYLRETGFKQPILGIEPDAGKIKVASERVANGYPLVEFRVGDARSLPEFSGDIVMLDVLHYMDSDSQKTVLEEIAGRIQTGGSALIRTTFRDGSWRYYATLVEEAFVRISGWIRGGRCHFPTREEVLAPFGGPDWKISVKPMWGRTPFNSHLVEISRLDPFSASFDKAEKTVHSKKVSS